MLKYHSPRWMVAYNSSNSEVPAYGLVEVNGGAYDLTNADGPTLQVRVDRPSEDSAAHIAINSWLPIPAGKTGIVTFDGPVLVATEATFLAGDSLGSEADSFVPVSGSGLVMLADMGDGKFLVDKAGGGRGGLIEMCLAENHPGRHTTGSVNVFDVYMGVWSAANDTWEYPDTTTTYKAIDRRYGTPYPDAGSKGLFEPRPSTAHGVIYDCVSLDCATPGACAD